MNKLWSSFIIFSFIYAIFSHRIEEMVPELLLVPEKTIQLLFNVGGLMILYTGIFHMAIDAKVIDKVGIIFKPIVHWMMPNIQNKEIIQLVCANITANLLGLGMASTPMVLQILEKMKKDSNSNQITKEMVLLLIMNVSCFTIFPLTIISIREKYHSNLGIYVWLSLICITFLTSLISILVTKWRYHDIHH